MHHLVSKRALVAIGCLCTLAVAAVSTGGYVARHPPGL